MEYTEFSREKYLRDQILRLESLHYGFVVETDDEEAADHKWKADIERYRQELERVQAEGFTEGTRAKVKPEILGVKVSHPGKEDDEVPTQRIYAPKGTLSEGRVIKEGE